MKPSAVLFDLDGTIYEGNYLVPGASEIIHLLRRSGIPYRFVTNMTRMTKKAVVNMLGNMGLIISSNDIFAAPHATIKYCHKRGYKNILLAVQDKKIEDDFSDFCLVTEKPEAVVLGDMGAGFTFAFLNSLFNHLLAGAELIAMHKNRYWKSLDVYTMDLGAFVAALEYSTNKSAVVIGKPNPGLFLLACDGWDVSINEMLVVGDDIDGDVVGAANAGMKSVLVKTGKYRDENLKNATIKPDYIINSVADLNILF